MVMVAVVIVVEEQQVLGELEVELVGLCYWQQDRSSYSVWHFGRCFCFV
jgi:hypothetical protein